VINPATPASVLEEILPDVEAGANVLVAGSSVFGESLGVIEAINRLRSAVNHVANIN
jgi:pentose-5-phosphate-3-epimerase